MPIHQLKAITSRPNVDHLVRLRASMGAYEALPHLAGHHQGLRGAAPWRVEPVATQTPHVFPLPAEIENLLDALFASIERLFAVAKNDDDDVRVAVFAAFGVTAVHPFTNANGRAAFDFAQLLLMHRGARDTPVFGFPPDLHQQVGPFLASFDEVSVSPDPASLIALAGRLRGRFASTRLEALAGSPIDHIARAIAFLRL